MDEKYLEIKIRNIKNDLDAAKEFFSKNPEDERVEEYLNDCIKEINNLKKKL